MHDTGYRSAVARAATLGGAFVTTGVAAVLCCGPVTAQQQKQPPREENRWSAGESLVQTRRIITQQTLHKTGGAPYGGTSGQGGIAGGGCASIPVQYAAYDWVSGNIIAQGGMVNTEIAAVSITVDPSHFPIRLDTAECLFSTPQLNASITTQWSMLVYQGNPNTGTLLSQHTITSGEFPDPPHIMIGPPNNAVHLIAGVDPGDPDQIIIQNNGTNTFSIGFRVNVHNQSATSSCPCVPGFPGFGNYPPICCPPPTTLNVFPSTDTDSSSPSFSTKNWLWARACPGATGFCDPAAHWYNTNEVGITGDWIIRVNYTPNLCGAIGACCLPGGGCEANVSQSTCFNSGGTYQGNGSNCATACVEPTGVCCQTNGACSFVTAAQCSAGGGTFVAPGGACSTDACKGACCIPSTGNCAFVTQSVCAAGGGIFQGHGVQCNQIVCFPIGACCLPSGSCIDGQSPSQCQSQGGVFQGNNTTCAGANCPLPEGACCLGTSCFGPLTESDCVLAFGGTWAGSGTSCGAQTCAAPACHADLAPAGNPDGIVNVDDLLTLLSAWGPQGGQADIAPPPNGDGQVNVDDLLALLGAWGPC